jgi:hypothetical protein
MIIGRYTAREQSVVLKALRRERGDGWAKEMSRSEYNAIVCAALAERYGPR